MIMFLAKRVMLLSAVSALAVFMLGGPYLTAFGLFLGAFVSVCKTALLRKYLMRVHAQGRVFEALFYIFSQASCFALLLAAISADFGLFAGAAAGLLATPAVICLNGVTEKTGLTHNGWNEGLRVNG